MPCHIMHCIYHGSYLGTFTYRVEGIRVRESRHACYRHRDTLQLGTG